MEFAVAILKPFHRICRPFVNGDYLQNIESTYLTDSRYAPDAIDYIRGYHLLEKELIRLFEFVEPADANLKCYSHQLYALFLRASTEFEANAKAVLQANGYLKSGNWNISDYHKLNAATRLSDYSIRIPIWNGTHRTIQPFASWQTGHSLNWYQAYNDVKHSRFAKFDCASLENVVTAVAAVFAVVFSQFHIFTFDPHHPVLMFNIDNDVWSHDACLRLSLP